MVKILVIGESCDDIFIYGLCDRLSPEAPVPVFKPIEIKMNKGMSGNVVENLKSIRTSSIEIEHWFQDEAITKTRYVDKKSNHMFLRVDIGEEKINKKIINRSDVDVIKSADIVIVSDYYKGFLDEDSLIAIGHNAKLSILDSKRILSDEICNKFSFIKLNEHEYKQNVKIKSNKNLIITLGSLGCSFNQEIFNSEKPLETIDVSGAGDTFTSAFILKYYETMDIRESLKFANKMASIVVSKRGVATP